MFNSVNLIGAVVAKQVQAQQQRQGHLRPEDREIAEDALFVYQSADYLECTNVATTPASPTRAAECACALRHSSITALIVKRAP